MKRPAAFFTFLVLAMGAPAAQASQPAVQSYSAMEQGTNRMGQDYRNLFLSNLAPYMGARKEAAAA